MTAISCCDAEKMNDSQSQSQVNSDAGFAQVKSEVECISPESVDEYMRDAARMVYDIIRDYLKEERADKAGTKKVASETKEGVERRTA